MLWIAPSERDTGTETQESRLWAAAEVRFLARRAVLEKQAAGGRRGSRVDDPTAYQEEGILLTPPRTVRPPAALAATRSTAVGDCWAGHFIMSGR
jgi:hypothetical protein